MGLLPDPEHAITRTMYGIGGIEIFIVQKVSTIFLDKFHLTNFTLQLGDAKDMHGFDAIIGSDFFTANKLVIDFNQMEVRKKVNTATPICNAITTQAMWSAYQN